MGRSLSLPALLVVLAAGCALQRGSLFPPSADEVHVEYFRNDTFYRDFEKLLTERIVEEINMRPGIRLAPAGSADVVLRGRVERVRQRVLSEDPERRATESEATVTAEYEIVDARSGDVIETGRISHRGEFAPVQGEDLESARTEAFRFLARDIVRALERDF